MNTNIQFVAKVPKQTKAKPNWIKKTRRDYVPLKGETGGLHSIQTYETFAEARKICDELDARDPKHWYTVCA